MEAGRYLHLRNPPPSPKKKATTVISCFVIPISYLFFSASLSVTTLGVWDGRTVLICFYKLLPSYYSYVLILNYVLRSSFHYSPYTSTSLTLHSIFIYFNSSLPQLITQLLQTLLKPGHESVNICFGHPQGSSSSQVPMWIVWVMGTPAYG